MGVVKQHRRHSRRVTNDRRWPALRLQALRRDGWQCVQCESRLRLEIDHIEPVRARPDLAFELANLQTLCGPCHTRKTRREVGHPEPSADRAQWLALVASTTRKR
jgi:5-methylcytosine-specific restriction endonuclease McrA